MLRYDGKFAVHETILTPQLVLKIVNSELFMEGKGIIMENIDYEGSKISKIHNSKIVHKHLIFE